MTEPLCHCWINSKLTEIASSDGYIDNSGLARKDI